MRLCGREMRLTEASDREGNAEPCPRHYEAVAVGDCQESEDDDGSYNWPEGRSVEV